MSSVPDQPTVDPTDLERWRAACRIAEAAVHRYDATLTKLRDTCDKAQALSQAGSDPTLILAGVLAKVRELCDDVEVSNLLARHAGHEANGTAS